MKGKKGYHNSKGYGGGKASEYPGRRAKGVSERGRPGDVNTPAVSKAAPAVKKEKAKPHSGGA